MLHTRSYRLGRSPELREVNNRLSTLRPFQVKGFHVSNRRGAYSELVLLHDEHEAPNLIETHPRFGSVINVSSGPSSFLLLFDIPIQAADLELNGNPISTTVSGDFVRAIITGNTEDTGEYIITGRVQSRDGVWSDSDCLAAYSLASTAPHSGVERPNHLDDGKVKCVDVSVDPRNTSMDTQNALMKRRNIRADEILFWSRDRRNDLVDSVFMLHRSPAPPNLIRIYPGHGASLPSGGAYHIAAAFDRKLAPSNWGKVYIDDVDKTSNVTLHDDQFSLTLPITESTGTHSIRFESLRSRNGAARTTAIISSFTIMPVEWVNPPGIDISNYYTKGQVDDLIDGVGGGVDNLSELLDVTLPGGMADGDYLTWDAAQNAWTNGVVYAEDVFTNILNFDGVLSGTDDNLQKALETIDDHDHAGLYYTTGQIDGLTYTLDGLTDVDLTSPTSGEFLKYDGSDWINSAIPGGVTTLAGLDDTAVSTPADGEYLRWNGSDWVNENPESRFFTETELTSGGALDGRYFTESEITNFLSAFYQASEIDSMLTAYYTAVNLNAGQLDNLYYTETELDAGQLDNRYYTETEVNNLLADLNVEMLTYTGDFTATVGQDNTLENILSGTTNPRQVGINTLGGAESIQINIGGTIFVWTATSSI